MIPGLVLPPDAALIAARILGSVALLALVMWAVSKLAAAARLPPEVGRKLVHVSLGLYCISFPWVFRDPWEVAATCALAAVVFALARGKMRASLGGGLHGVERHSYGELFFAVSVALLFALKDGHYITRNLAPGVSLGPSLYVLPILILTLSDAASALVGSHYGRTRFRIEEGLKSIEGVVAFAVTAWLFSLIALLLLTDIGRGEAILLALVTALFGALLEAASWRGLDNLFIPLGLYFLLANLIHLGAPGLSLVSAAFFAALVGLMWLTRKLPGEDRHFVAITSTLFFFIAIFSGVDSLLTPAAAVLAYVVCVRRFQPERPAHDALNLLAVIVGMALAFFLASHVSRSDTIFGYNLAFAALASGIVARFGAPLWMVAAGLLASWAAMLVRTLLVAGDSPETRAFALIGLGGIVAVTILGLAFRGQPFRWPWRVLGGASTLIGLAALAAAPR